MFMFRGYCELNNFYLLKRLVMSNVLLGTSLNDATLSFDLDKAIKHLSARVSVPSQFLLVFIRHVGCPFAERDLKALRRWGAVNPDLPIYVVSHGHSQAMQAWLSAIGGDDGLNVIIDESRSLYRAWGISVSDVWHFLGWRSLLGVVRLWFKGIRNRRASGTRWQKAGTFLVQNGSITWCFSPRTANEFCLPKL